MSSSRPCQEFPNTVQFFPPARLLPASARARGTFDADVDHFVKVACIASPPPPIVLDTHPTPLELRALRGLH